MIRQNPPSTGDFGFSVPVETPRFFAEDRYGILIQSLYITIVPTSSIAILNNASGVTASIIGHPTWDLVLIFFLLAVGFFYSITSSKKKLVSTLLLTYVAIAIFPIVPVEKVTTYLGANYPFYVKTGLFLMLFFLLYFFLADRPKYRGARDEPWWILFLLALFEIGLVLHTVFSFLAIEQRDLLAPLTQALFATSYAVLIWLMLPLVFLFFLKRRDW